MPEPTQHSRRQRLLLLATLGIGAGLGIALAVGSPAHADDQPTTDTIHEVVDTPGQILNDQLASGDQPQPVRELVTQALANTAAAVGDITRAPSALPHPPPGVGRVVDEVTDTVVEAVTPSEPPTTSVEPVATAGPTSIPDVAPVAATVDEPTTAATTGGPLTAPEPAPAGPPVLGGTGSGAPILAVQHPDARTTAAPERAVPTTGRSRITQREHVQPGEQVPPTRRSPRLSPGDDHAEQYITGSLRTLEHTAFPARTTGQPRWEHPHTGHHTQHHDGRTQPPSPPPG